MATRICLVGATGLIGSQLIAQAVARTDVRVVAVARREVPVPKGARMEVLVADPSGWADAIAATNAQVMVCALGTTWRNAGKDEAAFRAVDQDLVLACARAAKAAGIPHFILVSSVGANIGSSQLYLRVKGEVEDAIAKLHFKRLDILRPGLLRGNRTAERRLAERLAILAAPLTDLLLHGSRRKYRSISDETLVEAVFGLARERAGGRFVHDHDMLLRAARRGISHLHG
ncbi:MAG: NAD(P)H-binding protein [Novosphingobium sp.]